MNVIWLNEMVCILALFVTHHVQKDIDKNKLDFNTVFNIEIIICLITGYGMRRSNKCPVFALSNQINRYLAARNLITHLDLFASITIIMCTHWNWLVTSWYYIKLHVTWFHFTEANASHLCARCTHVDMYLNFDGDQQLSVNWCSLLR